MFETLEHRRLLSVTVEVFTRVEHRRDSMDTAEPLPGITVWADYNKNGRWDRGEPKSVSKEEGVATLENVRSDMEEWDFRFVQPTDDIFFFEGNPYGYRTTLYRGFSGWTLRVYVKADMVQYNVFRGNIFSDKDSNGMRTDILHQEDIGKPGVRVYLDLNRDGRRQKKEPSTVTNGLGGFEFTRYRHRDIGAPLRIAGNEPFTTPNAVLPDSRNLDIHEIGVHFIEPISSIKSYVSLDETYDEQNRVVDLGRFGMVFLDLNRNGRRDRGEPKSDAASTSKEVVFDNLMPGKYRLALKVNSASGFVSPQRYIEVNVGERASRTRGFVITGAKTLGFRFFEDQNRDGVPSPSELQIPITVPRGLYAHPLGVVSLGYGFDRGIRFPDLPTGASLNTVLYERDLPAARIVISILGFERWVTYPDRGEQHEYYDVFYRVPANTPSGTIVYLPLEPKRQSA